MNHRGQATAMVLNRLMLGLTRDTVDDSATVRVVGVVTLIYLPATFVAVRQSTFSYPEAVNLLTYGGSDITRNERLRVRCFSIEN